MFKYILASAYRFYAPFKREDPYFDAIIILGLSHFGILFLILALLKSLFAINILSAIPNKFIYALLNVAWLIFLFRYYNKAKVIVIIEEFKKLSFWKRKFGAYFLILLGQDY